ncbi:MAG: hypothetical protein WDZ63_17285 [Burkholderiales bacterium]
MKRIAIFFTVLAACAGPALADDIDQLQNASQAEFRLLSEDLGAALSYKPLSPAEPLGITGFDIGLAVTATDLEHSNVLEKVTSSSAFSTAIVPSLHLTKGLPLGIDVGAMYVKVPELDISLWGVHAKYAILDGGIAMPALAVRGSYTRVSGIDQLDFDTKGLDISMSKGFAFLTPYVGAGIVWVTSTPRSDTGLREEKFEQSKLFGGINLNFGLFNMAFEADRTGDANSYGAKIGLRF